MTTNAPLQLTHNESQDLLSGYIRAISGIHPNVSRKKGLLLTEDEIKSIKKYVRETLAINNSPPELEYLYKLSQLNIPGLGTEDVHSLFNAMQDHAGTWSALEADMKTIGSQLYVFANELSLGTDSIIEHLETFPGYESAEGTVGDLSVEEIEQLPEFKLTGRESKKIPALIYLVDDLKALIENNKTNTANIKTRISAFKNGINKQNGIKPRIQQKLELCRTPSANENQMFLDNEIDRLNNRIEEKMSEIESYVDSKWWGLLGGGLGFYATSTIFGKKADNARKELDALTQQKTNIQLQIAVNNVLRGTFEALNIKLQNLQVLVTAAEGGASSLESFWELLYHQIDASSKPLKKVTNAMLLVIFGLKLKEMNKQWSIIETRALDLLNAFNAAADEA